MKIRFKKTDAKKNGASYCRTDTGVPFGQKGRPRIQCWQDLASFGMLFTMLYITVESLARAHWISPQPELLIVLFLALVTGLVTGLSRLHDLVSHSLALILGLGVSLWQMLSLQPYHGITARFSHLMQQLQAWLQATVKGSSSPGTVQVALLFCLLAWLLGYLSTYFLVRKKKSVGSYIRQFPGHIRQPYLYDR